MLRCRAVQPPAWSNWTLGVDEDIHLSGVYGVQSSPLTHGHSDPDDMISTLYARMLIAETTQPSTRADCWSADVGLSPGCRSIGVDDRMSASGGSSAETGSFVFGGPGGAGGMLADLYDNDDDNNNDDNCWDAFSSGFFDGSLSAQHLRAGLGAAAGDVAGTSAGPLRLKPDVGVSAVIGGGSCGSDGAMSPSSSPAESSTGSAA